MNQADIAAPKKTARRKRTAAAPAETNDLSSTQMASAKRPDALVTLFSDLIAKVSHNQQEFEWLQKEIEETRKQWIKEQQEHELELASRQHQEEVERAREQEAYTYAVARKQKLAEDEFTDRKTAWEKQLREQQAELERDKRELEQLRKLAASFEEEKAKVAKEAQVGLQRELTEKFDTERKLREQEFKAQIELLNLKIANLTTENTKQVRETETLRKTLDEATRQLKEIAVKVIESGGSSAKLSPPSEI